MGGWGDSICVDFTIVIRQGDQQAVVHLGLHPPDGRLEEGDQLVLASTSDGSIDISASVGRAGAVESSPYGYYDDYSADTHWYTATEGELRIVAGSTPELRRVELWAMIDGRVLNTSFEVDASRLQTSGAWSYDYGY